MRINREEIKDALKHNIPGFQLVGVLIVMLFGVILLGGAGHSAPRSRFDTLESRIQNLESRVSNLERQSVTTYSSISGYQTYMGDALQIHDDEKVPKRRDEDEADLEKVKGVLRRRREINQMEREQALRYRRNRKFR